MKTVWKFDFGAISELNDYARLWMPKFSEILTVKSQKNKLCLWCLCDDEEQEKEQRIFRICGTGHPIKKHELKYINTCLVYEENLVIHIFEVLK
jgi:hypothetical protein